MRRGILLSQTLSPFLGKDMTKSVWSVSKLLQEESSGLQNQAAGGKQLLAKFKRLLINLPFEKVTHAGWQF